MKTLYTVALVLCLMLTAKAQTPQGINYQGVARNAAGVALTNQAIGVGLSVLDGSATGTAVYTETHVLTTDANGLFTLVIGAGTPSLGTFGAINWATGGGKWLKVSMDAAGGAAYQLMGTSQLLSVPYALYAGNVTNNGGKQTLVLSDDVTDTQAIAIIAAEVGPNTQEIKIVGTTNLTTVDLSMITTAINIEIANNAALTTVNLSALTRCDGSVEVDNSPLLSNLNISSLAKITTAGLLINGTAIPILNLPAFVRCSGYLNLSNNTALTSISMPNLTESESLGIENNPVLSSVSFPLYASNNYNANLNINNNASLTSVTFPSLTTVGDFNASGNNALTSISLPFISSIVNVYIVGNTALTTIDLSALASVGVTGVNTAVGLSITGNTLLSALSLPALTTANGFNFRLTDNGFTSVSFPALTSIGGVSQLVFGNNKLPTNQINAILAKLVAITPALTGKYIDLYNQTPLAPPSGQGITDKATLVTNGNNVNTD